MGKGGETKTPKINASPEQIMALSSMPDVLLNIRTHLKMQIQQTNHGMVNYTLHIVVL